MMMGKKRRIRTFFVSDLFLVTAEIISSYNDGNGAGPRAAQKVYFAAVKENDSYYELFSNVELKKEEDGKTFNIPYITKVEPLRSYVENEEVKMMDETLLFYFILNFNLQGKIKIE